MSFSNQRDRPRVIVDANVFVSYLLKPEDEISTVNKVVKQVISDRFELIVPDWLVVELRDAPAKPKFAGRVSTAAIEVFLGKAMMEAGIHVATQKSTIPVPGRDLKDRYLIEAAIYNDVDILVSGDKDLLVLGELLEQPRIMSPAQFVAEFGSDSI